jgi:NADH:ubiquinone oxidoreductase subunit 6 (subunit J)
MVGVLTIALGLVAAALAFAAQYLDADAWGRDYIDLFVFVGAVSTAFVAGASIGRLVQNRYPPPGWRAEVSATTALSCPGGMARLLAGTEPPPLSGGSVRRAPRRAEQR